MVQIISILTGSGTFYLETARYSPETITSEGRRVKSSLDPPLLFRKQPCDLKRYFRVELVDQPGVYIKHNGIDAPVLLESSTGEATCFRSLHYISIISALDNTRYVYQDLDNKQIYLGQLPQGVYRPKYFQTLFYDETQNDIKTL